MTWTEIDDFVRLVVGNIGRRLLEWSERKQTISVEELYKRILEK